MPKNDKEYMRKYYQANKQKFKDRAKLRYTCPCCNIELSYCNKSAHERTRKHKTNVMRQKIGGKLDDDFLAVLADEIKMATSTVTVEPKAE